MRPGQRNRRQKRLRQPARREKAYLDRKVTGASKDRQVPQVRKVSAVNPDLRGLQDRKVSRASVGCRGRQDLREQWGPQAHGDRLVQLVPKVMQARPDPGVKKVMQARPDPGVKKVIQDLQVRRDQLARQAHRGLPEGTAMFPPGNMRLVLMFLACPLSMLTAKAYFHQGYMKIFRVAPLI